MTQANEPLPFNIDILPTIHLCSPDLIHVENRRRKSFPKDKHDELVRSIKTTGQTTPGLCFVNDANTPQLIFGERRLRACAELGIEFRYQLTESKLTPYQLAILEIHENIKRENFTWREKADARAELHRLSQEEFGATSTGKRGGHGIKDTAAILGESAGNVSEDIQLAEYAAAIPEVADAPTRKAALKIVARLKNDFVRDAQLEKARKMAAATGSEAIITPSGEATTEDRFNQQLVYFDSIFHLGRMENILTKAPPQDVVIFDPPWGVDYDTVAQIAPGQQAYEDDEAFVKENLPEWLRIVYSSMSENSHLYLFFGIVHHEFVYSTLESVGFTVNRMPIFWHKQGQHRTRSPKRWPGRCYEAIAFAHKGRKDLYRQGAPDIISTPAPTPTMKQSHPSAKHPAVYVDLLERSCSPGDNVCDPMAGSAMFGVAADALKDKLALNILLIEKEEEFRNLGLFNLARGYQSLTGDTGPVVADLPEDFRELTPGSDEWKRFWEANPDQQAEMLAWRKGEDTPPA